MIKGLIKLIRPKDWVKGVFILAPLPFALTEVQGRESFSIVNILLGFFGFCFLSSFIYVLNDIQDAEKDRHHPKKKNRPIAAGVISAKAGSILGLLLLAAGFLMTYFADDQHTAVILGAVYILINLFYCFGAKHIAPIDVFMISSGFVIRVLVGCALMQVTPSNWLLLCTGSLSLFLAIAKRRADIVAGMDENHRPSLKGYNLTFVDQALSIMAGITILSYGLYSIEGNVFTPGREFAGSPFVVLAVIEYLRMAHTGGYGGSPIDAIRDSRTMQISCVCWLIATLWSLNDLPSLF